MTPRLFLAPLLVVVVGLLVWQIGERAPAAASDAPSAPQMLTYLPVVLNVGVQAPSVPDVPPTATPTATPSAIPSATPPDTATSTASPFPTSSITPTPTASPTVTGTPSATSTPTPSPTVTPTNACDPPVNHSVALTPNGSDAFVGNFQVNNWVSVTLNVLGSKQGAQFWVSDAYGGVELTPVTVTGAAQYAFVAPYSSAFTFNFRSLDGTKYETVTTQYQRCIYSPPPTATPTMTPTATNTPTSTPTHRPTHTPTMSPTSTGSPTPTITPLVSGTPTTTPTGIGTDTPTVTPTGTDTETPTLTSTVTETPTSTTTATTALAVVAALSASN